jgi:DNA-binding GntR family transcriptional regulator
MPRPTLSLSPLEEHHVLKDKVYRALKDAITDMDIYGDAESPRLDERSLAEKLGVSRTPVREALSRLEQEGLVETVPRRGAFVVRKNKEEILEMIHVWAALEGMAARLATQKASDEELRQLHTFVDSYDDSSEARAHIDEYSETNIRFHQNIIRLGKSALLEDLTENLFIHMKSIRARTIKERDRASQSIIDHARIIEALESRETELAERLVRDHALELAEHVRKYVNYLD